MIATLYAVFPYDNKRLIVSGGVHLSGYGKSSEVASKFICRKCIQREEEKT